MKTIYVLICMFTLRPVLLFSQTPDWSTGIASIIYEHCSHCHHEGAIAPFALMSYEDAALWAFSIQVQVNAKIMPPWPPDPNYNHLKDENVLSPDELSAINNWVNNDMPIGDIDMAPTPPAFSGGSLMIDPDETIQLPIFSVPDVGNLYWHFANQSSYSEAKYINSIEFVAGNPSIVHHLLFGKDSSGISYQNDLDYPGPGYPSDSVTSPFISSFMAQSEGRIFSVPENIGFEVQAGSDYVTNIHYYTSSVGETDSSKVNLKFCAAQNVRPIMTSTFKADTLYIPANTVKQVHIASEIFSQDRSLLGLGPHAHLICKSWEVYMIIPSGDTIPLISIPNWDFSWQGGYLLTKVVKIPQGSKIYGNIVYDNTSNNPNNPSNPPKNIHEGPNSWNEMGQVRLWLMDYQAGDEDIILDSAFYFPTNSFSINKENMFSISPNPAGQKMTVEYWGNDYMETFFFIHNQLGQQLYTIKTEYIGDKAFMQLDCSAFPSGLYLLTMQSGHNVRSKKFVVEK